MQASPTMPVSTITPCVALLPSRGRCCRCDRARGGAATVDEQGEGREGRGRTRPARRRRRADHFVPIAEIPWARITGEQPDRKAFGDHPAGHRRMSNVIGGSLEEPAVGRGPSREPTRTGPRQEGDRLQPSVRLCQVRKLFSPLDAALCVAFFISAQGRSRIQRERVLTVLSQCGQSRGVPGCDSAPRRGFECRKLGVPAVLGQPGICKLRIENHAASQTHHVNGATRQCVHRLLASFESARQHERYICCPQADVGIHIDIYIIVFPRLFVIDSQTKYLLVSVAVAFRSEAARRYAHGGRPRQPIGPQPGCSFGHGGTTGDDVTGSGFAASHSGGAGSRCPSSADRVWCGDRIGRDPGWSRRGSSPTPCRARR